MPRLYFAGSSGPGGRVTTIAHVMSGSASPGQHVWIGRRLKSGDKSVCGTVSRTTRGRDLSPARAEGQSARASLREAGGGERIQAIISPSAVSPCLIGSHARGDAGARSEQVCNRGNCRRAAGNLRLIEAEDGVTGGDHPAVKLGGFERHVDRCVDRRYLALCGEAIEKTTDLGERGRLRRYIQWGSDLSADCLIGFKFSLRWRIYTRPVRALSQGR